MIIVIGSANMDLVVPVKRLPMAGETLLGSDPMTLFGGKGANQAIAARRLGAEVEFICSIGNDDFGRKYLAHLQEEQIGISHVRLSQSRPTGIAMILVDDRGENVIVVSPGANHDLTLGLLDQAEPLFLRASLVLVQFEVPFNVVRHAITLANKYKIPVMLNPSPVQAGVGLAGLDVDYLVLNQVEAETLSGITSMGVENLRRLTSSLRDLGAKNVIMTRGADNTVINAAGRLFSVPTLAVQATDTVGAGDTFAGALAVALNEGRCIEEAVRFANCAASLATMRLGAQSSMPRRNEVEENLPLIPA